jgi:paraquat-inducible protein B
MIEEHVRMMEARITKQIMEQLNVNVEQIVEVKFNKVTKQLDEKYDILRTDILTQVRTIDSSQSDRFDSVDVKFDKLQSLLASQGICCKLSANSTYPPTTNQTQQTWKRSPMTLTMTTFMNYKPLPLP